MTYHKLIICGLFLASIVGLTTLSSFLNYPNKTIIIWINIVLWVIIAVYSAIKMTGGR